MAAGKSTPQESPSPDPVVLSPRKKLVFSALVLVGVLALLEVLLALLGVKPTIVARDPYVGFQSGIPLVAEIMQFL